jgi:putative colanic acid biosynthesis acetyltransferase WcaF
MNKIRLDLFSVGDYRPGGNRVSRIVWYLLGQRILRSQLVTSYRLKASLLRIFGAKIGTGLVIKPGVRVKYPWRLRIGDHVWIGEDAWIDNLENVAIGNHSCLSQGVYLCTGNHDWNKQSFDYRLSRITIGQGAWIGAKSLVGPGVTVADYAILTAGSVATRSLAAGQIYTGNPAVFVKHRWPADSKAKRDLELHENTALSRFN